MTKSGDVLSSDLMSVRYLAESTAVHVAGGEDKNEEY